MFSRDVGKKRDCSTESRSGVECEPAPPEHAESDDRVGGAAHGRVAGDVPTAESGPDHFSRHESWKKFEARLDEKRQFCENRKNDFSSAKGDGIAQR